MESRSFTYVTLATVSVQQPFYTNNVCRNYDTEPVLDFQIYPTDECRETMRRLDLLVRRSERSGGLVLLGRVLGKTASGENLLRFPAASADKLTFWMQLRNPDVLNFDELPVAIDASTIFYFTNQRTDPAATRDNLHLTDAATGVSATSDRIVRSSENYRFHHAATVATGAAKVTHLLSGREIGPASIVNQSGQADLTFDLNALPLGKCQLSIGGVLAQELYYEGNSSPQEFGVIELALHHSLAANYRIVEPDRSLTNDRPAYSILFLNRQTRWRYTIHLPAESPLAVEMSALSAADKADFLDRLNVTTNDGAVTFSRGPTSDSDIVFISDTNLALQERYVSSTSTTQDPLSLTLKKYLGVVSKEAVVRSDLPYPHSLIDARAAPLVYSDTFLTL